MEKEYNKLTKRLLAEGYTADHYPEYVQIGTSRLSENDPLNNLSGGFEYRRYYSEQIVYKTGCGKFIMGSHVLDDMGYEIDWNHENDNPVFRCPYNKPECEYNDPRLYGTHGGGLCICFCTCHKTDDPYDYENSIEKANAEREEERKQKYEEYSKTHNGRICQNHMFYNERTRTWSQNYDPTRCPSICYQQNGYCPILGRQLSKKRGNVYYDLKESGAVKKFDNQIGLFDRDRWEQVTKGIRFLKKPCSMDICEAIVKTQVDQIRRSYEINNSTKQMFDKTWKFEIYNVRAESKPSRDLMQDLQDLRDGVELTWEDDRIKEEKERKKEKRTQLRQKAIDRLEKKLVEIGYENLPDTSIDRVHADKWLDLERLEELENIRKQKIKEEQEKPVQLSLFD